ncbi:MAG: hypothetical protein IJ837_01760 [Clostridia bacterium]|nr:hypothetical protein [Clostridia bacterium]
MSKKTFNRYELGIKTTTDILESEKADVDEIEISEMLKKDDGRVVDYKKRHQDFLQSTKNENDDIDLNEIKKFQMQVYSSNSSELYDLTSKSSIFLTVLSVIFSILLLSVAIVFVTLTGFGYSVMKYDKEDMGTVVKKGNYVLVLDYEKLNSFSPDDQSELVIYKEDGQTYIRIITEIENDYIAINNAQSTAYKKIMSANIQDHIKGVVQRENVGWVGAVVFVIMNYWYYLLGGLFILVLASFVAKLLVDRYYNNLLINKLEIEREHMEKRRKYLADNIIKMQQSKNMSASGANVLGGLLNVNKTPDHRRDKKMKKLQEQLKNRQMEQIENIKKTEEQEKMKQELENQKEQEKQVVDFLREKIIDKEKKEKQGLSEEEIQRRREMAEETNKNIGN